MGWLALGVAYSIIYAVIGAYLRPFPGVLPWFRIVALLLPPLAGVAMIARRRHSWAGCQWLFWATLALGLLMSGISVVGWSVDEMMLGVGTSWLGWHAVFALFGGVAPLLALLAQPHRGPREKVTATIAVDIAGIAVLTGFLYSHFAVAADPETAARGVSGSLLLLSELQQFLVCIGMGIAAAVTPDRGMEAGVSAARDRTVDFVHHVDPQQRRNLAGLLPDRVARRRDVDSAVRVLSMGGVRRTPVEHLHPSRRTKRTRRHRARGSSSRASRCCR